jgi:hypothetical protein
MMALAGSALWSGCLELCSSEGQRRAQHLEVGGTCQSAALNSLARDSSRVNCIPEEELSDAIMAGIEEDTMADDVDAENQFYK